MNKTQTLYEALKLYRAGFNVLPVSADGSKHTWYKWTPFKEQRPSVDVLSKWIMDRSCGLAVLGGASSGGLECLDFDRHSPDDPELWTEFKRLAGSDLDGLPIIASPSNGVKVYWRYDPCMVEPSRKLAVSAKGTTLCELLSTKLNLVVGGHPAAHKTGIPYRYLQGHLAECPTIALGQRTRLISLAKGLTVIPVKQDVVRTAKPFNDLPIDTENNIYELFKNQTTWQELLEPFGWYEIKPDHWVRPDKTDEHGATTNDYCFYVFTSSAPPFEQGKHNKVKVFTLLMFGGDTDKMHKYLLKRYDPICDRSINYVSPLQKLWNEKTQQC